MLKYSLEKIPRSTDKCRMYYILDKNMSMNLHETIIECFFVRDHRDGRGERDLGRVCFNWLADMHPIIFLRVFQHIPVYGRWDDLLYIKNPQIKPFIYDYLSNQINTDYFNMTVGNKISICAKWMPTEGKSFARHRKSDFCLLLKHMKMTPKEYRVRLTNLRSYLDIPEHHLCSGNLHLLDKSKMSKGSMGFYESALKNREPWVFKVKDMLKSTKKRIYVKRTEKYNQILNDLKIGE